MTDSGIGIPPEEIGQLFEPLRPRLQRADRGAARAGLGLSIVKAIAELHGGRVMVDSTLGQGTTFSVYLPAAALTAGAGSSSSRTTPTSRSASAPC